MPHAELKLTLEKCVLEDTKVNGFLTCDLIGCEECLTKALTIVLLNNPKIKAVFNNAAKAANVIRQSQMN